MQQRRWTGWGEGEKSKLQGKPCLKSSKTYSNYSANCSTCYFCRCAPTVLANVKQFLRGLGSLTFLTLQFHSESTSPWKKLGCRNVVKHEGYAINRLLPKFHWVISKGGAKCLVCCKVQAFWYHMLLRMYEMTDCRVPRLRYIFLLVVELSLEYVGDGK